MVAKGQEMVKEDNISLRSGKGHKEFHFESGKI